MKLPFKIVWRSSEEDQREKDQERRLADLDKRLLKVERDTSIWRPLAPYALSNGVYHPVSSVLESLLRHLQVDVCVTPRREASLTIESTIQKKAEA